MMKNNKIEDIPVISKEAKEIFIQGLTHEGKIFRPSDWAERLAGVVAQFTSSSQTGQDARFTHCPWCTPTLIHGVKCVVVQCVLQTKAPQAWNYILRFAADNALVVTEGCGVDVD